MKQNEHLNHRDVVKPGSEKTFPLVEHTAGHTVLMCFQFRSGTRRQVAGRVHHTADGGGHSAAQSRQATYDLLQRPPAILGPQSCRHHTGRQRVQQTHWTKPHTSSSSADRILGRLLRWRTIYNSFSRYSIKVKASHTRHRALGPELIPVYRQSACR